MAASSNHPANARASACASACARLRRRICKREKVNEKLRSQILHDSVLGLPEWSGPIGEAWARSNQGNFPRHCSLNARSVMLPCGDTTSLRAEYVRRSLADCSEIYLLAKVSAVSVGRHSIVDS